MEQGDEVLFYRTNLYEELLGKIQRCGASSETQDYRIDDF